MKGYLFVVVIAILCIACGGSSGGGSGTGTTTSTTSGATTANPWTGTYVGQFEDLYGNVGTLSMAVTSAGTLSGQFGTAAGGSADFNPPSGSFMGEVNSGGVGDITVNGAGLIVELGVAKQSTLSIRFLAGTQFEYWGTAVTNPTGSYGGANPFAGQYSGTVYYPNLKLTAAVSVVIGADGSMNGLEGFDLVNGEFDIGQLAGTLSSSGALNYTVGPVDNAKGMPETLSGSVTLSNGTISGTLKDTNGSAPVLTLSPMQ